MKKTFLFILIIVSCINLIYSQENTSPLPNGDTKIGGHLHAGSGNEVWSDASSLYFNYRGSATATYFWNLGASNGYSLLTINNNGNVGVGTNSPSQRLHVWGDMLVTGLGGSPNSTSGIKISSGISSTHYNWMIGGQMNVNTGLEFTPSTVVGGTTYNNPVMTLLANGNVGVGATSPGYKLVVAGDIQLKYNGGRLLMGNGNGNDYFGSIGFNNTTNDVEIKQLYTDGGIKLITNTSTQAVTIHNNGNVDIGTPSTGDYKLNVVGKIRANEVVVNTTGADFVFAPGYKLPSLSDLETYIKENNHLPEIASAGEMKENGMNMSEMQTKLLQKIEELTLYSIEQEKKINEQEKKNIALENEVKELKALIMKTLNGQNK
jgi:hypothetical protein